MELIKISILKQTPEFVSLQLVGKDDNGKLVIKNFSRVHRDNYEDYMLHALDYLQGKLPIVGKEVKS